MSSVLERYPEATRAILAFLNAYEASVTSEFIDARVFYGFADDGILERHLRLLVNAGYIGEFKGRYLITDKGKQYFAAL